MKKQKTDRLLDLIRTLTKQDMPRLENKDKRILVEYQAVLLSSGAPDSLSILKDTIEQSEKIFKNSGILCFSYSKNKRTALIDKQIFFPYFFKADIKFNIHVPEVDQGKVLYEDMADFHDLCELNSILVSYKSFNRLGRNTIEQKFNADPVLRNQTQILSTIQSSKHVGMTMTIGLTTSVIKDTQRKDQHIYKVSQPQTVDALSRLFFGNQSQDYQMTCIVLRPFVVMNSLEELFLNVFRINGFNILDRTYKKLDNYELNLLARIEGVEDSSYQNYCKMMTIGRVCIVAMINFSAVHLANYLSDGHKDFQAQGRYNDSSEEGVTADSNILLELLTQSKKKPKTVLLQEFLTSDDSSDFKCLENLINYDVIFYRDLVYEVLPNLFEEKHISDRIINQRNVRRVFAAYRDFYSAKNFFNLNVYTPLSISHASELISVFLPSCLTKSSALLVLHPEGRQFEPKIKESLKLLEYDITWEGEGIMNAEQLIELGLFCDEKNIKVDKNRLELQWSQKMYKLIRVSRVSGKKELERIVYTLNFEWDDNRVRRSTVGREAISSMCVLSLDEVMDNFFYKTSMGQPPLDVSPLQSLKTKEAEISSRRTKLVNFVLSELSSGTPVSETDILNYKVKEQVYSPTAAETIITVRARTAEGNIEVRVTTPTTSKIEDYEAQKIAGLNTLKIFYESISRNYLQKAPSISHSRIMAYEPTVDSARSSKETMKKVVIELEEDLGVEFAYEIMYQIEEYNKQTKVYTYEDDMRASRLSKISMQQKGVDQAQQMSLEKMTKVNRARSSMIAFVWGSLLSVYIRKAELTDIRLALKCPLFQEFKLQIEATKEVFIEDTYKLAEETHYKGIVEKLRNNMIGHDMTPLKLVQTRLKKIFKSDTYRLFREEEVMIFCPKYLDIESLRIFSKDKNLNLEEKDEHIFGAKYLSQTGFTKDRKNMNFNRGVNFDYAIQNAECGIYGRYRLHAQVEFLIEHQLDQFVTENGKFLKGHESYIAPSFMLGYRNNYKIEPNDEKILTMLAQEHQTKFERKKKLHQERYGTSVVAETYELQREYEETKVLNIVHIERFLYLLDLCDRYSIELTYLRAKKEELITRRKSGLPESPIGDMRASMSPVPTSGKLQNAKSSRKFTVYLKELEPSGSLDSYATQSPFINEIKCSERIIELETLTETLLEQASKMDLDYKGDEEYLQNEKLKFVPLKQYFEFTEGNNINYDLMDEKYYIDISTPPDVSLLEKYGKLFSFMNVNHLDRMQRQWFQHVPLKVHYLRPVINHKDGIFVEKDPKDMEFKKKSEEMMNSLIYYKTIDL